ncbi:hypothetical protein F0562_008355 [Nyssa sinensis]|uniref:Uncharacterized protein n=1 Tax=Nyssa sinensis TaxID=561372 RepID=A0A5J5A974_9ASTE|nr:hypothetical protein F0562_008355 [Nyssa sinensis]
MMEKLAPCILFFIFIVSLFDRSLAGLLSEPAQPLNPGDHSTSNTVPAFPVQTETQTCRLDLSAELFGGVKDACGRNLDRSRCCPVLAAWLFAAHASSALQNLERNCRNSSYAGCTKCLGALQKLKGEGKNGTDDGNSDRASRMFGRDCQLMGLTWLLARNKTAYIPTVSAVLRAIMYSAHPPHESKCSPDQENMPLAVDSLQFEMADSSASSSPIIFWFPFLPLIILLSLFV